MMRFPSEGTHNNSMQRTALRAAADAERWPVGPNEEEAICP
jgi:hypothetical protein